MTESYVLDKKCPKCFGLGKTANPTRKKLIVVEKKLPGKQDDPPLIVCEECNGTGMLLPTEVKELLEYILS